MLLTQEEKIKDEESDPGSHDVLLLCCALDMSIREVQQGQRSLGDSFTSSVSAAYSVTSSD